MARRDRRLQQVERAGHVGIDKGRPRMARDIRLVERRGMDHRFDAMAREGALDHCSLRHRTDEMGVGAGRDVQADRDVVGGMESG